MVQVLPLGGRRLAIVLRRCSPSCPVSSIPGTFLKLSGEPAGPLLSGKGRKTAAGRGGWSGRDLRSPPAGRAWCFSGLGRRRSRGSWSEGLLALLPAFLTDQSVLPSRTVFCYLLNLSWSRYSHLTSSVSGGGPLSFYKNS